MRFRAKLTIAMVLLLSLTYGIGGSLMIAQSFSASIDRERDAAVQTYRMVVDVLDLLGDNASPGTAANTVALVLHKLGSGGSSTAARIRFGAQMTTTGDTALLDAAPEPSDGGDGLTRIVRTGNGRHYLMLGATADGTTVSVRPSGTEPKIKFYFGVKAPLASVAGFDKTLAELDAKIEGIKRDLKLE